MYSWIPDEEEEEEEEEDEELRKDLAFHRLIPPSPPPNLWASVHSFNFADVILAKAFFLEAFLLVFNVLFHRTIHALADVIIITTLFFIFIFYSFVGNIL